MIVKGIRAHLERIIIQKESWIEMHQPNLRAASHLLANNNNKEEIKRVKQLWRVIAF